MKPHEATVKPREASEAVTACPRVPDVAAISAAESCRNVFDTMKGRNMDFLVGKGLKDDELEILEKTTSPDKVKSLLEGYFNLGKYAKDERRREIALDFHLYNYDFCKKTGMTREATALFMKMMDITFTDDTNPPPSRTPHMQDSFDRFVEMLLKHSVQNPPFQLKVFERSYVDKILDYVTTSYFRQFRLYQYIFCSVPRVVIEQANAENPAK